MATSSFVDHSPPHGLYAPTVPQVSSSEGGFGENSPSHMVLPLPHDMNHPQLHDDHGQMQGTEPHHLDAVQAAADVAAALTSSPAGSVGFTMLSPDDAQQGALGIDDL